jgi:hypothetical protein
MDLEITFQNFITLFPAAVLPISLTSESQRMIAQTQQPMNDKWAVRFLLKEDEWLDEYTEFMACFSLPTNNKFYGLVYWQATILGSSYELICFGKNGEIIDRMTLAGTKYEENELVQTVCTIRADWTILQGQARLDAHKAKPIPAEPELAMLKIAEDGEIIEL